MTTKYIVNNLTGQTISGDLTITGNLRSNDTGTYKALLTETGSLTGTTLNDFNYGLIIGETYTITSYQSDDDFSNIANVLSGNINETGCVFVATGETPNRWFSNSELVSVGGLVVTELENSLGFSIYWVSNPMGGSGYYFGFKDMTGPIINTFPRRSTYVNTQTRGAFFGPYGFIQTSAGIGSIEDKDDVVFLEVYDWNSDQLIGNALYYTPIEIVIKQDLDTTPVEIFGTIDSFPFPNVSYTLQCGSYNILTYYSEDGAAVNNITELVDLLNNNTNTNQIGLFSANGETGIKLTIAKNFEDQLCPDSTLTFFVFND